MSMKEKSRPGGRSARVQASVHQAVRALMAEMERSELTFPLIAARAGVTPSTLYRRWGELPELLADVAVERLRPDGEPADTGSLRGDLVAWVEQYVEEMSSTPGRAMIRDVLAGGGDGRNAGQCCGFTRQQLAVMTARAGRRGEVAPDVERLIDGVVAPLMYRILFDAVPVTLDRAHDLVDRSLFPETPAGPEGCAHR